MALTPAEIAAHDRSAASTPAAFDANNGYETLFPQGLNDMAVLVTASAREASASGAARAVAETARGGAENARDVSVARAAETATDRAAAKASADSAAALAASFEIDVARRSAVPPILDWRPEPEVAPASPLSFARNTAATRINRFGFNETVAANAIRHDYERATGSYRGVLFEEARVNVAHSVAPGGDPLPTYVSDGTTSSSGATDERILLAGASDVSTAAGVRPNLRAASVSSVAANEAITVSVSIKLKAGGARGVNIRPFVAGTGLSGIEFGEAQGLNERTWVRRSFTFLAPTSGPLDFRIKSSLPDGGAVYFDDFQVERGNFATSYITTTNAEVSRAADVLTASLSGFNALEGSVFARGRTAPGVGIQTVWQIDDGSQDKRIFIRRNLDRTLRLNVISGGATSVDLSLGVVADATEFAVSATWRDGDFAVSLNGSAPVIAAATLPTGFTTERFGLNFGGTLSRVVRWPRRLSNDDLQAISKRAA